MQHAIFAISIYREQPKNGNMFVWLRTLNPDFERLHFFLIPQSQFLYCIYDNKVPTFIVHIQVLFFLIELQILNNPLFLKSLWWPRDQLKQNFMIFIVSDNYFKPVLQSCTNTSSETPSLATTMQQDNDKGHLVIILILIDDQEIPYMALITYCSCLFARCFVRLFAVY